MLRPYRMLRALRGFLVTTLTPYSRTSTAATSSPAARHGACGVRLRTVSPKQSRIRARFKDGAENGIEKVRKRTLRNFAVWSLRLEFSGNRICYPRDPVFNPRHKTRDFKHSLPHL